MPAAALIVIGPALLLVEAALLGLALAFLGVELATHAVMVFSEDEAPAFVVRSVLVGWLLVRLAVAPLQAGLRRRRLAGQAIGEG